jgi:CRISPR-associated protein Csm5
MTKEFLKVHRLALTPLAPIHIGLGEEFDPTGYIIDPKENLLYAFDPSRASLPDPLRKQLLELADSGQLDSIHKISKLIREHGDHFLPHAHSVIPVSSGVVAKYQESLSKSGWKGSDLTEINRNFIERAIFLTDGQPFIPGSGVKGVIRTAWLEALYRENPDLAGLVPSSSDDPRNKAWERFEKNFERNMLEGDFQTSPFRLLKIADFLPLPGQKVDRKIVFACNYKKQPAQVRGQSTVEGRGPSTRKEVILPGQYRFFEASLTLVEAEKLGLTDQTPRWQPKIEDLARHCQEYHWARLHTELKTISGLGLVNKDWANRLRGLLESLDFQSGRSFLLRLGRYGAAETKTVAEAETKTEAKLPRIKIMGFKSQGVPDRFEKAATTLWLAGDHDKANSELLPFGWALMEIDPDQENGPLRAFCQAESKGRPNLGAILSRLAENKTRLKIEQEDLKRAREAEKAQKKAEDAALEAEKQALAALSPEQTRLREFSRRLELQAPLKPSAAGAAILADSQKFLEDALAWPETERQKCAEILEPLFKAKNMFIGAREKPLKRLFKELRGQTHG